MPWPLIAAEAGLELGKGLAGYLLRPKVPRIDQTATGKLLLRRSTEGIYNKKVRRNILNAAGRASGAAAQTEVARTRGGLLRSGFNDSIAGARLLAEPGLRRAGYLAETGQNLETENELAKVQAREGVATFQDQLDEQRRNSNRQGLQSLLTGVVNAGGTAGMGILRERQLAQYGEGNSNLAPLAEAYRMGIPVSPYAQRYFINRPNDQGLTPEELEFIRSNPGLFQQQ